MVNSDFTEEVMFQLSPEMWKKGTGLPPRENRLKQKHGGQRRPKELREMEWGWWADEGPGTLCRRVWVSTYLDTLGIFG